MINDWDYLYSTFMLVAAPTIALLKPATLISFSNGQRPLGDLWGYYQQSLEKVVFEKFKLRFFEIRTSAHSKLVFCYHPLLVQRTIDQPENNCFLGKQGLSGCSLKQKLAAMKTKMASGFPHEIGILLGFPIEDVCGFINNKGENYLLNGYWKVYQTPDTALRLFNRYDEIKQSVLEYFIRKWEKYPGR